MVPKDDINTGSDIVIRSRVRLARNIGAYPFPSKMNDPQYEEVLEKVRLAVMEDSDAKEFKYKFFDMQKMNKEEKQVLVEKQLISPELAVKKHPCGALVNADETVSIMVNEEDHIRIQCLLFGMRIDRAKDICFAIDKMLEKYFDFAFSAQFGYLTSCPTNIGTAIRASVLMHLPAMTMCNNIPKLLETLSKLGITVRGIFGEHTQAKGNLFQISNQVTLGQTEDEIVASLKNVISQVKESENSLRNEVRMQNRADFDDSVFRAYGVLTNARKISADESLGLISMVRMGADMGIIDEVKMNTLNKMMYLVQPAIMRKYMGSNDPANNDILRATMIREHLKKPGKDD